ncbi:MULTISPECIES: hypothetical protein [Streptomyces]|uniref:Uncharacterized protein n=1 Tax=Streptomyces flavovirens TaxID=52258 RepID=A0ABV8NAX5_9ACTN|nr:hypothetical protein [Streptomyces sp. MBT51]MBK3592444.1 hypothetical protein [Streptomyces sp. MBT51]
MILSGAASAPRVDVEPLLMCDVLPDGTTAGQVLVEPIYDTTSGERIGTRTVDPVTGDPYTVTGALGPCAVSQDCEEQTTPTATVGLCLADGTPIAVTIVRDCTGAVTSEGWINLQSGAYSAGAPPVGTVACGSSQSVQVSGTFCDVDDAGDVVGLVLIEYSYAADGTIDSVRLVDATTGDTYTPAGTVTTCPAGVEQPERDVVQLCDTAGDGTVTPFVRDYARDENGAIVGHSDYTLDGSAYTPAGTVGACQPGCKNATTVLLCDVEPDCQAGGGLTATAEPNPSQYPNWALGSWCLVQTAGQGAAVWTGGSAVLGPDPACPTNTSGDTMRTIGVQLKAGSPTATAPVPVTVSVRVTNNGPNPGVIGDGRFGLWNAATGTRMTHTNVQNSAPVGHQQTLTLAANVPAAALAAGQIVAVLDVETYQGAGGKAWTIDQFVWSADVPQSDCQTQFLRTITTDCATGETVTVTDTTLDGAPYTVTGDVAQCQPAKTDGGEDVTTEPCTSSATLTLCDSAPIDAGALVAATATDPTPYFQTGDGVTKRIVLADPQPLFDGGTLVVAGPPGGEPGPEPVHRYAAALLALPAGICPPCGDWPDTMTLTVAARATNNGPVPGNAVCGRYTLFNGATILGENEIRNTPVGGFSDFSVSATVSYADMVAGTIALKMDLETRHLGDKSWTVEDFTITLEAVQTGCGESFLRTIRRDCVTGELVDVLDTDYDGQPYTPVGEVASCTAHSTCGSSSGDGGGGTSDCEQCTPLVLCDVLPTGDVVSFLRTICLNCIGGVVGVMDTALDGVTAYEVAGTVRDCGNVGDCPTSYSTECWSAVSAQASYDNTRGNCGGIDPGSMGTCAGNWRISSWIIDGAEQIPGAPAQFVANGCGGAAGQFHAEWATALGVIDPSSTWEPAYNGSCLFFIRTSSMDPDRVYGQMTVYRTEAPTQVYTLTPVASRTEVSFTKRFTQECDGTTSVTWLDADGVEIDEPEGDLTFCGAIDPTDPTDPDAGVVSTGVRAVTGTAPQDLVAEFAGLQSISLAVLAGTVEVTVTDGTAVAVPAGVTLTWSVAKDTDTALAAASFVGADASASYLLNWTYLS